MKLEEGCDSLAGMHAGMWLVYKLVRQVYVMVIAPRLINAFIAVKLTEALARALIAISKTVDVTAERVSRSYPQVCPIACCF